MLKEPERLSLLYVVHGFPPHSTAGTEVYTLGLAKAMRERGHAVTVVARAPAEAGGPSDWTVREDELEGVTVWRVIRRIAPRQALRESYKPERALPLFRSLLARARPDLVHYQHLLHLSAELPLVSRELGIPAVITCNDYWALCARVQLIRPDGVRCEQNQGHGCLLCIKDKGFRSIPLARRLLPFLDPLVRALAPALRQASATDGREPRSWREHAAARVQSWTDLAERQSRVLAGFAAADLLMAPSHFLRQKLLDTGRFDPARIIQSGYGMRWPDPRGITKVPSADGSLRIGFIGSLLWYKGVHVLVEALARLARKDCVAHVYGDFRPETDPYHRQLQEQARAGKVVFHGRFDNSRLSEIYREIDVLVVPSLWFENAPLAISEAFLHHTPVVTSDIGGMAELVGHERSGLHFRTGDASELGRALARLIDEPDLLPRLARGIPSVKSLEQDADELERRYYDLLGSQRLG